jgi:hypothetical protein
MKKTLTCLLILLVASSLTLTMAPNASAQTSNVRILDNYSFYEDSLGNLVVIGEVQNVGSSVIGNVTLTGDLTSDSVTAQGTCAAWGYNLLPGQKAPFYMELYKENSGSWTGVVKSDISLEIYKAPESNQYMYQGVQVASSQATPTATGEYWVTAQLQNSGTQTAQGVWAYATFFNAQGEAVGSGWINPISSIAAGATTTIKVPCWDLNQTIVDSSHKITAYSLLVQVTSPMQTATEGNIPVVSDNPTPVPAGTSAVSNGSPTNGIDTTTIILVVIVTVALIAVAAILIVKKRKQSPSEEFEPAEHAKKTRRERRNQ